MHTKIWVDMLIPGLPVIEKILRAAIVYLFLVVGFRLAGKRQLANLNPFDLVVLLTISNTVQNAIIGEDNSLSGGLIGATTLLVVNYFAVRYLYAHRKLRRLAGDAGEVLIENGKIRHDLLKKNLVTLEELREAANRQGFESLRDVDRAVFNPDGTFSFFRRKPQDTSEQYQEVIDRLDRMAEQMVRLRPAQGPS